MGAYSSKDSLVRQKKRPRHQRRSLLHELALELQRWLLPWADYWVDRLYRPIYWFIGQLVSLEMKINSSCTGERCFFNYVTTDTIIAQKNITAHIYSHTMKWIRFHICRKAICQSRSKVIGTRINWWFIAFSSLQSQCLLQMWYFIL